MHLEGQGTCNSEDIQLVIAKAAIGNLCIPKEVAA